MWYATGCVSDAGIDAPIECRGGWARPHNLIGGHGKVMKLKIEERSQKLLRRRSRNRVVDSSLAAAMSRFVVDGTGQGRGASKATVPAHIGEDRAVFEARCLAFSYEAFRLAKKTSGTATGCRQLRKVWPASASAEMIPMNLEQAPSVPDPNRRRRRDFATEAQASGLIQAH